MTGPHRSGFIVALCALVLSGALSATSAAAQTPSPSTPSDADTPSPTATPPPSRSTSYQLDPSQFSLLVSPARLVVEQDNLSTTHQFSVVNRGQAPLDVQVQKRNFVPGPDGSLNYQADAPWGAASWLSVSPVKLRVQPGETRMVSARATVPNEPEPGDHQVALVFLVPSGETEGNIKVNRGVATPIYLTVPWRVDSSVQLASLTAPSFARRGPVRVTATVRNVGTVHRDFRKPSPLTMSAAGSAEPFPDFTVARGAVRHVSTTWSPPLMCICHVSINLANPGGAAQAAEIRVIVFPWDLLGIVVGGLLLLLVGIKVVRRRYQAQVTRAAAGRNPAVGGDA